jgi:hypothetical protein
VVLCANGLSRVLVVSPVNRPLAVAPVSPAAGIVSLTAAVRLATAAQPRSEVAAWSSTGPSSYSWG